MPKKMLDYTNSCVYRIAWKEKTYYVGSTINFAQREYQHKNSCKDVKNGRQLYRFIRNNGGWTDDWCMVIVNEYPECKTTNELHHHERNAYDFYKPELNVHKPAVRDDERVGLPKKYIPKDTTFHCKLCNRKYLSRAGLFWHTERCKPIDLSSVTKLTEDLHAKMDNMKAILLEFAKNLHGDIDEGDDDDNAEKNIDDIVVSSMNDDDKEEPLNVKQKHYCTPCGYPCNSRSNLTKHFKSKKHKDKIQNPDAVIVGGFKCLKCDKVYKSNPGLWAHKKVCVAPEKIVVSHPLPLPPSIEENLHTKIENLEKIIIEMAMNQQLVSNK